MDNLHIDLYDDAHNPLDCVEDVLTNQDWVFSRLHDDELVVQVQGRHGPYRLTFLWQESRGALQFFCEYDFAIAPQNEDVASRILRTLNERLFMGHFDIPQATQTPTYRYTSLCRGWDYAAGTDQVEDLVDVALKACENRYQLFALMAGAQAPDEQGLMLLLTEDAGQA